MKKNRSVVMFSLILIFAIMACNLPVSAATPTAEPAATTDSITATTTVTPDSQVDQAMIRVLPPK